MKILLTGSAGFVGKNLAEALETVREGKYRPLPSFSVDELFLFDKDDSLDYLDTACRDADFVLHFAGANRPETTEGFTSDNVDFTSALLRRLEAAGNCCPVLFSSSAQASLCGRFSGSEYGKSKLAGEKAVFAYAERTGAPVFVYRFPNLFGKWCRPNYNSAVATFCNNIANDLPITVSDPSVELELVYIDDLVESVLQCLSGIVYRCNYSGLEKLPSEDGSYCYVPVSHKATLGTVAELLYSFRTQPATGIMPSIPENSFEKKLFSTYLSYLPEQKAAYLLNSHSDERGSFTELLKFPDCGQISVNICKPGYTKGQHWHHSKWEIFIVVSGHGLIRERKIGSDEILSYEVTGDSPKAVYMLPGYTHSTQNLSETEDLVTVMWANEQFNPDKPDTFYEAVD